MAGGSARRTTQSAVKPCHVGRSLLATTQSAVELCHVGQSARGPVAENMFLDPYRRLASHFGNDGHFDTIFWWLFSRGLGRGAAKISQQKPGERFRLRVEGCVETVKTNSCEPNSFSPERQHLESSIGFQSSTPSPLARSQRPPSALARSQSPNTDS